MHVKHPFVIGISGTHGTGKSSIFDALAFTSVPPFNVDRTQLSRSAQKNLGWDSLSVAGTSIENAWALQDSVIDALIRRDEAIVQSEKITVVERSPLDVWAYMLMWCEKLDIDPSSDRVQEFKTKCIDATKRYSHIAIVPASPEVPFKFDPHRGDEKFRQSVEEDILRLALEILDVNNHYDNYVSFTFVKQVSIRDRALEIKEIIYDAGHRYMSKALYASGPN